MSDDASYLRAKWPSKSAGKRFCPRCGTDAPVFFAAYSSTLTFKNHKDAGGIDYCRNSRWRVNPEETREAEPSR